MLISFQRTLLRGGAAAASVVRNISISRRCGLLKSVLMLISFQRTLLRGGVAAASVVRNISMSRGCGLLKSVLMLISFRKTLRPILLLCGVGLRIVVRWMRMRLRQPLSCLVEQFRLLRGGVGRCE